MARSVGVPAREIFGIRIAKEGDITGAFHCRGEFYLPGYGWVPVDPSDVRKFMLNNDCDLDDPDAISVRDYYFGAQTETYIDFYSGRDVILIPEQESGPLNYLMYPYAEVGGKTLDWFAQEDLTYTVTFKEL
jgi:transglutaminase-like putative cysteine protease